MFYLVLPYLVSHRTLHHPRPFHHIPFHQENLESRLKGLLNSSPIMLFMKGTADSPQCGFSRTAVGLLRDEGVEFGTFDILEDNEVRQGLKKLSEWPTYPQVRQECHCHKSMKVRTAVPSMLGCCMPHTVVIRLFEPAYASRSGACHEISSEKNQPFTRFRLVHSSIVEKNRL